MIPTNRLLTFLTILMVYVMTGGCAPSTQTVVSWKPTTGTDSSSQYLHQSRAQCMALAGQATNTVPSYQGSSSSYSSTPPTYDCVPNLVTGSVTCNPAPYSGLNPSAFFDAIERGEVKREKRQVADNTFSSCMIGKGFYKKTTTYEEVLNHAVPPLGKYRGLYYQFGHDRPYTGTVSFPTSRPIKGFIKDGREDGEWIQWWENGTVHCRWNYKIGSKMDCPNPSEPGLR